MIKNYYIHDDNCKPELPIAKLTIHETLDLYEESVEIIDENRIPATLQFIMDAPAKNKVTLFLEDRVMPANRMFFSEYCKENGLDPNSIDDKLTINKGRIYQDSYFIVTEYIKEDTL